ncbi:MAG: hypothetical protein LEGION0398_MBIBDBAK_01040 [Legionellaceae bacterium]
MDLITMIMACSLYRDNAIVNAMVKLGSQNNPLQITSVQENATVKTITAPNPRAGEIYVNQELANGHIVYIGLMQISSGWLKKYKEQTRISDLFRPCKNMAIATMILNHTTKICAHHSAPNPRCALAVYQTGANTSAGKKYAAKIITYAKTHQIPLTPNFEPIPVKQEDKDIELPMPEFNNP